MTLMLLNNLRGKRVNNNVVKDKHTCMFNEWSQPCISRLTEVPLAPVRVESMNHKWQTFLRNRSHTRSSLRINNGLPERKITPLSKEFTAKCPYGRLIIYFFLSQPGPSIRFSHLVTFPVANTQRRLVVRPRTAAAVQSEPAEDDGSI